MAPKKKEVQKFSLGEFMQDSSYGGSWADEVEDTFASGTQPLPPPDRRGPPPFGGGFPPSDRGSYAPRDSFPQRIPDRPPYTAHLGNLSYDATVDTVSDFFGDCEIVSVRIVEDREQQRPKGFGYAEFASADGLRKALTLDGVSFQGRSIRVRIADPPKDRDGRSAEPPRELDWSQPRKGPLADIPRSNDRRSGPSEFGDRRGDFQDRRGDFGDRRAGREPVDDGKVRDLSDWSRKGPLSPRPEQMRQPSSREGSRPPLEGGGSDLSHRNDRRHSPAAWGEGRQQQEGSRPPRREFADRPERVPSAAERDMQWRNSMRPDSAVKSPGQSRSGSEAPPSPAPAAAVPASTGSRPKLNLAKRTISEAPAVTSPALTATDSKSSPFGAARPIDTAAKEREIEEKRLALLQEKKEAEERAKEEQRLAKEAAEQKADEQAMAAPANGSAKEEETLSGEAKADDQAPHPSAGDATPTEPKLPVRQRESREPREPIQNVKTRAAESGNWRQASGEHRGPRGAPTGPRRGGGASRGARHDGQRPPRANGGRESQPSTPVSAGPESTPDEDGWTTVKKAKGGARPLVS